MKQETTSLQNAVLNTNLSGLFFFAMCFSCMFLTGDSPLHIALPVILGISFIAIYNFIRQCLFFAKHPQYIKQKRFYAEIVAFVSLVVLAIILILISVLCDFKSYIFIYFLAIKFYFSVAAFAVSCFLLGTAQRLGDIWDWEKKNSQNANMETEFELEHGLKIRSKTAKCGLLAFILALAGCLIVLIVGLANALYYMLGLPVLLASFLFAAAFTYLTVHHENVLRLKTWQIVVMAICYIAMIVLAHVFTISKLTLTADVVTLEFEIYTIVLLGVVFLAIFPFVIFGKRLSAVRKEIRQKISGSK